MRRWGRPGWVYLTIVASGLGTTLGGQKQVVVSSADSLTLRWTAHRLGVSVERVEQGRKALQVATALVPEVAGRTSVGSLGDLWSRLNWPEAGNRIATLIKLLRQVALHTEDPAEYGMVTADAKVLKSSLVLVDEEAAAAILDDWPDPPAGPAPAPRQPGRDEQLDAQRRIQQLAARNLDAALKMLRETEAGQPNPVLRRRLLIELEISGREAEADQLYRELIEAMPKVQDETVAWGYNGLLVLLVRFGSEFLPEFLPAWAELTRRFPLPTPPSTPHAPSIDLLSYEKSVLRLLEGLRREAGWEVARQALGQFPELVRKLDQAGGLESFLRASNESREERNWTMRHQIESSGKDGVGRNPERETEIRHLVLEAIRLGGDGPSEPFFPELVVRNLGEALRLLKRLEDSAEKPGLYLLIAQTHLRIQGEISSELIQAGRKILQASGHAVPENPPSEDRKTGGENPKELSVWLFTARCWMSFDSAIRELQSLDEEFQFAVTTRFAGWVGERSFR